MQEVPEIDIGFFSITEPIDLTTPIGSATAGMQAAADAVAGEVAPFGIKVVTIVPGPVRTDFIGRSLEPVEPSPEYVSTVGKFEAFLNQINGKQPGDPLKAAAAVYR